MKIPDFSTGSEKMCQVFYTPKQPFLLAHTDVQELATSFTTVRAELETEEISLCSFIITSKGIVVCTTFVMLAWSLSCTKVPYLLARRLNTCTGGIDLAGKSENVHSHFFSPLACSALSAVLKDYHLHWFFSS